MPEVMDAEIGLETRLIRLETIVSALEREDLELEEALRLFEEGIAHLRSARETLRHSELRIDKLLEVEEGVALEPMKRSGE